jgi:hypothetical protein
MTFGGIMEETPEMHIKARLFYDKGAKKDWGEK